VWEGCGSTTAASSARAAPRRLVGSAKALAFAQIPSREEIVTEIRRTLEAKWPCTMAWHIPLTLTRGVKITSGMESAAQ